MYFSRWCVTYLNFSSLKIVKREWNCFSPFQTPLLLPESNFWLCNHKPTFDWSSMIIRIIFTKRAKVTYVTPNFWSWILELLQCDDFTLAPVLEVRTVFYTSWGFLTEVKHQITDCHKRHNATLPWPSPFHMLFTVLNTDQPSPGSSPSFVCMNAAQFKFQQLALIAVKLQGSELT